MVAASNDELIGLAQAVLNPRVVDGRVFGDVASTLVTDKGNRYSGVCIDTASGTGFCAEHSAIAAAADRPCQPRCRGGAWSGQVCDAAGTVAVQRVVTAS